MIKSDPYGELGLSNFMDQAQQSLAVQQTILPTPVRLADSAFLHVLGDLKAPRDAEALKMFMFSYCAWRHGVVIIAYGGPTLAPVVLRRSLEAGLHGYLFARDAKVAKQWRAHELDRKTDQAFRGSRKLLSVSAQAYSCLAAESPALAASARMIEGQLIDHDRNPSDMFFASGGYCSAPAEWSRCLTPTSQDRVHEWLLATRTAEAALRLLSLVFPVDAARTSMDERLFTLSLLAHDLLEAAETSAQTEMLTSPQN